MTEPVLVGGRGSAQDPKRLVAIVLVGLALLLVLVVLPRLGGGGDDDIDVLPVPTPTAAASPAAPVDPAPGDTTADPDAATPVGDRPLSNRNPFRPGS